MTNPKVARLIEALERIDNNLCAYTPSDDAEDDSITSVVRNIAREALAAYRAETEAPSNDEVLARMKDAEENAQSLPHVKMKGPGKAREKTDAEARPRKFWISAEDEADAFAVRPADSAIHNYIAVTECPQNGAVLTAEDVEKIASGLICHETFHHLGGIDDCEPCKSKSVLKNAIERTK